MRRIATSMMLIFISVAPVLADDAPCPPKNYFCWEAKLVFQHYGVDRVVAKAKACGWTQAEIASALKCRKKN